MERFTKKYNYVFRPKLIERIEKLDSRISGFFSQGVSLKPLKDMLANDKMI